MSPQGGWAAYDARVEALLGTGGASAVEALLRTAARMPAQKDAGFIKAQVRRSSRDPEQCTHLRASQDSTHAQAALHQRQQHGHCL